MSKFKVLLTRTTACGVVGQGVLGTCHPTAWSFEPELETVQAVFTRMDVESYKVLEVMVVDGSAWRALEESGQLPAMVSMVEGGASLAASLPMLSAADSPRHMHQLAGRSKEPADALEN